MTSTTNVETNQASEEQPRYIESASATTNPDNANSGAKAYVIAAIGTIFVPVSGLIIILALSLGSIIAICVYDRNLTHH